MSKIKKQGKESEMSLAAAENPQQAIPPPSSYDELKALVEKNIKWSQVVYEQNRKIQRRLTLMAVGSYLRLLVVVVPLILAFIYLPPLIKEFSSRYGEILRGGGGSGLLFGPDTELNDILSNISGEEIQGLLRTIQGGKL